MRRRRLLPRNVPFSLFSHFSNSSRFQPSYADVMTREANETVMISDELFPLSPLTSSVGEAEYAQRLVDEYPTGHLAVVYRDPNDCSDSFLMRYTDGNVYILLVISLLIMVVTCYHAIWCKRPPPFREQNLR